MFLVPVCTVGDPAWKLPFFGQIMKTQLFPVILAHVPGEELVGGGLQIRHRPMVDCIGRCQVFEESVVSCLADPLLLTILVVVVGIIGNLGTP